MTVGQATDLWLGELERLTHTERTLDTYRRLLDKLADVHPSVDVDELTATQIRRFLTAQGKKKNGQPKAPRTIAQNVTIVNTFFDWLTKEGVIGRNPTRRNGERILARPALPDDDENDNIVTVSLKDVANLRAAAAKGPWNERLAINVLCYIGPRRRAVSNLRVSDYDRGDETLTFREKGKKTITKPVPGKLADLIEAAIAAGVYESDNDYLVPSNAGQRRDGDRDDRVIWRLVRRVAQRAGVTTHVHALRAAFADYYLETHPGQVEDLKQLMGHRRLETTLVYLRRRRRRRSMETVRDLDWDNIEIPQNAPKLLESLPLTEKEGFEPSMEVYTPITP